jgi:hypothetical protein
MTDSDFRFESMTEIGPDEPMSDELCTSLLSLHRDGRSLHPRLVERAETWASSHPACQQALGDFAAVSEVLSSEPSQSASRGFAERVLAKRRRFARGGDALPLLRRLSIAAALLLGLTLIADMTFPAGAAADDELARQEHQIDTLHPDPFAAPDLEGALQVLLPDVAPLGGEPAGRVEPGGDR